MFTYLSFRYVIGTPLVAAACFLHALTRPHPYLRLFLFMILGVYGTLIEMNAVIISHLTAIPKDWNSLLSLGRIVLTVGLSWSGIIYSTIMVAEAAFATLSPWTRYLFAGFVMLNLDFALDPLTSKVGEGELEWIKIPCVNLFSWFVIPTVFYFFYTIDWPPFPRGVPYIYHIGVIEDTVTPLRYMYWGLGVIPLSLGAALPLITYFKQFVCSYALTNFTVSMSIAFLLSLVTCLMALRARVQLAADHWSDAFPSLVLVGVPLAYIVVAALVTESASRLYRLTLMCTASSPMVVILLCTALPLVKRKGKETEPQPKEE
ncbi:hypothetical protein PAPYR_2557 [Paratrimastix pyriformis]|uniref:Uncharacterized protein n=1 Tax=Paratrimastix pyriformis TaxID=342808 RepID=A0ABQ8UPL3_9EUKA|nr:hypothetical protein PAPYR_2557 [Paratrimastix pyriformis]